MDITKEEIQKVLLAQNYITEEELQSATKYAKTNDATLIDALIQNEFITEDLLGQALAEFHKMQYINIDAKAPSAELIQKLPEDLAKTYVAVMVSENEKEIQVTTANIDKLKEFEAQLKTIFPGKSIKVGYSLQNEIDRTQSAYRKSLESRFSTILKDNVRVAPEIIFEVIEEAVDLLASDIHIEPQETEVTIRFRIDGVLQEVGTLQKDLYDKILNTLKVAANLRLDEHFSAQDGAIRLKIKENPIDLRISIVPTINGQNIVIRILSQYIRNLTLADLGLSSRDQEVLERAYKRTFGMILTTGPTGSGKTTTLYSIIKKLQSPNVNITTIEDPVEYKIPGINQIQVNQVAEMTFARGLRSIVRQDPNIILVGEIRDEETAEIAINAALTGHLLLSTFHANDASTVIPRLFDMGAEPFLLASTLNLIVAQRLARRICNNCRFSKLVPFKDLKKDIPNPEAYFEEDPATLYEGKGCSACNGTGYKGRVGLYELIYVSPEMQELILHNPSSKQIKELAYQQGARSFFQDGMDKVKNGMTTLTEILRVAPLEVESTKLYGKSK